MAGPPEESPAEIARRDDFVIEQGWPDYGGEDHDVWRHLFERQSKLLPGRACGEYLRGLECLGMAADGIPDFRQLSDILERATGWRVVAVPGLVPDEVFFAHLAARRFPATNWIRAPEQMDYLQEPDIFHDVFGHVPMLMHPVFADYMAAYGRGGLKAARLGALTNLARLYWYTVEFGLIRREEGLRIYGAGIVSSSAESAYCLESPRPRRVAFDLMRVMRTDYLIDRFQDTYFVIDGFDDLFAATQPDFTPLYEALDGQPAIAPDAATPADRLVPIEEAA
jgi:phenylalanine-4-hydroxylase